MAFERFTELGNLIVLSEEIGWKTTEDILSIRDHRLIVISSCGGDIGQMLAIYDHISHYEWNTFATGVVQSAAAVLLQAGKTRIMSRNALLRFIPPEDNQDVAPARWHLHSIAANLVRERTGMALPESYDLFDDKFINAERALQLGLIDKIEGREDDYGREQTELQFECDRFSGGQGSPSEAQDAEFNR